MTRSMVHVLVGWGMLLFASWPVAGRAQETPTDDSPLAVAVAQPTLAEGQMLADVEAYLRARIPPLPEAVSVTEWNRIVERTRRRVLDEVVFRGEAVRWRDASTGVEWLEELDAGPGYRIRKLRYEALPGLWIPALLYEPDELDAQVPVVLNVNGHDGDGKAAEYKQLRCINLAKRGMLALNVEWFGMGQLKTESFLHYRANQLDLCGTPALAPFVLSMRRGIDLLLAHEHADPDRVAVTGLSGGGWQTMVISALDPRVTLAVPVAGYASAGSVLEHHDLGDTEQSPTDLHTVAEYALLTAMRAPKPTLLVYNAADGCCFRADHALEPLLAAARPAYRLFGAPDRLRWHVNYDPGHHNYERDNREALYRAVGDFFYPGDAGYPRDEIASDAEVLSAAELEVALPEENADFNRLARMLAEPLPASDDLPDDGPTRRQWQADARARLAATVRLPRSYVLRESDASAAETVDGHRVSRLAACFEFSARNDAVGEETACLATPIVDVSSAEVAGEARPLAVVLADEGRAASAAEVRRLAAEGWQVRLVDPFGLGEAQVTGGSPGYLYALQVANIGDRPLGLAAAQVLAACAGSGGTTRVVALGPRVGLIAMVAAALGPEAVDELVLDRPLGSLHEIIDGNRPVTESPELFCFGLLREFDVPQLAALVEPRSIEIRAADARARKSFADYAAFADALQPPGGRHDHGAEASR